MGIESGSKPEDFDYEGVKATIIDYVLNDSNQISEILPSLRSPRSRQIRLEISEEYGRTMTKSQTDRFQKLSRAISHLTGDGRISRDGEEFFDTAEDLSTWNFFHVE